MNLRDHTTVTKRRQALEKNLSVDLTNIGKFSLDEKIASSKNCENMIGAIQVPVGVAGPLQINTTTLQKTVFIPLATTEGALVASVSRGCKAITQSNGTTVISKKVGITRAPVFVVDNLVAGKNFIEWIETNFKKIKEITESTSSHLTFLDIKSWQLGRNVFLRFRFNSQDAMGMNMATIAVSKAVAFIESNTDAQCIAVSGNMCVDKKPNFLNFIEGRGYSISAEAIISPEIVAAILKTTPHALYEVAQRKILYGSLLAGSIGANAQFANILAALFLATGQDIAHVAECSTGITTIEVRSDGSLYAAVSLPDLVVGTVGGGTTLATQKEALSILGVAGGNAGKNAQKFAEIIGGAVLAGELSLLASLAENSLATAHQKLGRGQK